jgi:hypothetical protein
MVGSLQGACPCHFPPPLEPPQYVSSFVLLKPLSNCLFIGSFEGLSLGDTGTEFTEESLEYVVDERPEEVWVLDTTSHQLVSILVTEYSELVATASGDAIRETLVSGIIGVRDGCVIEELVEYAWSIILAGNWEGSIN